MTMMDNEGQPPKSGKFNVPVVKQDFVYKEPIVDKVDKPKRK